MSRLPMLWLQKGTEKKKASFYSSIFHFFGVKDTTMHVHLHDDKAPHEVTLELAEQSAPKSMILGRAEDCPLFHLATKYPRLYEKLVNTVEPRDLYTQVAFSTVIENMNTNKILLTQRASNLRSFKSEWVTPGGHFSMKKDATWRDAAIREALEETGINLKGVEDMHLFACWESVFPTTLLKYHHSGKEDWRDIIERTLHHKTRHHLVLYYYAKWVPPITDDPENPQLVLQNKEVQNAEWLDVNAVESELANQTGKIIAQGTRFCMQKWLSLQNKS